MIFFETRDDGLFEGGEFFAESEVIEIVFAFANDGVTAFEAIEGLGGGGFGDGGFEIVRSAEERDDFVLVAGEFGAAENETADPVADEFDFGGGMIFEGAAGKSFVCVAKSAINARREAM